VPNTAVQHNPEVLLAGRSISKSFGGIEVLQGIDIELRGGEVHALLGENGAGKSTLAKILCGFEKPDAGELSQEDGRSLDCPHLGPRISSLLAEDLPPCNWIGARIPNGYFHQAGNNVIFKLSECTLNGKGPLRQLA